MEVDFLSEQFAQEGASVKWDALSQRNCSDIEVHSAQVSHCKNHACHSLCKRCCSHVSLQGCFGPTTASRPRRLMSSVIRVSISDSSRVLSCEEAADGEAAGGGAIGGGIAAGVVRSAVGVWNGVTTFLGWSSCAAAHVWMAVSTWRM